MPQREMATKTRSRGRFTLTSSKGWTISPERAPEPKALAWEGGGLIEAVSITLSVDLTSALAMICVDNCDHKLAFGAAGRDDLRSIARGDGSLGRLLESGTVISKLGQRRNAAADDQLADPSQQASNSAIKRGETT